MSRTATKFTAFIAAAALNAVNFVAVLLTLPESRRERTPLTPKAFNPFAALHGALKLRRLGPLLVIMGLLALIGQVGAAVWVLYTADRYGWSVQLVGLSLALFGLAHAGAQAFVPGPMIKRFGERRTAIIAMSVDAVAYVSVGLATQGWILLAMTPVFCIGGIAMPALQAMMTREVGEDEQGQLQGNLAALNSLAGIVGPAGFALLYAATKDVWPGLVWAAGASLYLLCVPPLVVHMRRSRATGAPA
ncbi:MAG: MFS transporter [Brevundimonas sp.]|nr:MAG: MFS transporter [Brevundimonas sp.]